MSQRPFPKPLLAEPLPEEIWFEQTDRSEVGRESFFYGRDAEYDVFRSAVESLGEGIVGGGTMIFHGAPGAGKTALMLECMEAVRCHSTPDDPWVAVSIQAESLKFPTQVVGMIVNAANTESERLSKIAPSAISGKLEDCLKLGRELFQDLSERGAGVAGFSVGGKAEPRDPSDSSLPAGWIFAGAAPLLKNFHVVVFVDEAQNTPVVGTTRGVMDCLNNPPKDIPLVTAFFGLSDIQQVLRECGFSRFPAGRVVNLEPLSMDDAAGSFRRMLDTYFTGEAEEKSHWESALAELSQGWPQHINRIGVAAGRVIRANQGRLERHLLEEALEKGTERKNDYYAGRLAAGSQDPGLYKHLALTADRHPNRILSRNEIIRLAAPELEVTQESFNDFLKNALHAGLLAPVVSLPHHYQFPTPSLSDYLRSLPVEPSQVV